MGSHTMRSGVHCFLLIMSLALVALPSTAAADNYLFTGDVTSTSYGATANLRYTGTDLSAFANLTMEAMFVSQTQLRVRIYPTDATNILGEPLPAPFVVPDEVFPGSNNEASAYTAAVNPRYAFSVEDNRTIVIRDTAAQNKIVYALFNFTYQTQMVGFSTVGEQAAPFLFGYGEHDYHYFINQDANVTLSLWNTDNGTPWQRPMYGVHPIVFTASPLTVPTAMFSGMLWLNSHAQSLQIVNHVEQTFFSVGGIIDVFVFLGNSSLDVTSQYHRAIGPSAVPPFWALGIHQCRWGYHNLSEIEAVLQGYIDTNMPLDVLWNDIDYMDNFRVFTTDPVRYPQAQLEAFVQHAKSLGVRYVQITDPGVATQLDYETYTSGIAEKVFVTEEDGVTPLVNVVWPGWTVFPDFSLPHAVDWWAGQIAAYRKNISIDGMWLDMNELGTFCAGQCRVAPGTPWSADWKTINWGTFTDDICVPNNCTVVDSPLNYPPVNPLNNSYELFNKTLDMTGKLAIGRYYDTKAFYGFLEGKATYAALWNQTGARPFILTRASFVGSGRYAAHWTGDNVATWTPKQGGISDSVQGVLAANLWGILTVGADIGGFGGISNEELVVRWYQLGVFYTFTRNHHDLNGPGQEPYKWSVPAQNAIRDALQMRYRYMPYLFTSMLQGALGQGPVLRHLSMEFPMDLYSYTETTSFMFGSSILVVPIVEEGATSVDAYLPPATWYNATSLELVSYAGSVTKSCAAHAAVGASYSDIPVFLRGGSMFPIYDKVLTTLNATQRQGAALLVLMANVTEDGSNETQYAAHGESWFAPDSVEILYPNSTTQFHLQASGIRSAGVITSRYFNEVVPSYNFELTRRVPLTVVFPYCDPAFATHTVQLVVTSEGVPVDDLNAKFTCNSFTFDMPQYQDGHSSFSFTWAFPGLEPPTPAPTGGDTSSGLTGRDKHIIIGACIGGAALVIIVVAVLKWVRRPRANEEGIPLQEGERV